MDLKKLYYQVKSYIDIVDFSKLWRGFEPLKFALYSDNECFFDGAYIEKTDAFLANTSILYNGEWIAIWNAVGITSPGAARLHKTLQIRTVYDIVQMIRRCRYVRK